MSEIITLQCPACARLHESTPDTPVNCPCRRIVRADAPMGANGDPYAERRSMMLVMGCELVAENAARTVTLWQCLPRHRITWLIEWVTMGGHAGKHGGETRAAAYQVFVAKCQEMEGADAPDRDTEWLSAELSKGAEDE